MLYSLAYFQSNAAHARNDYFLSIDSGGHRGDIWGLAFTPDGKQIVSAGDDKVIRVWDIASRRTIRTIYGEAGRGKNGKLYALALSADGRWLAVGGQLPYDGADNKRYYVARIYDFASGDLVHTLAGHTMEPVNLAFSPSGDKLISASQNGRAVLWSVADGRKLADIDIMHFDASPVAFSGDGSRVFATSSVNLSQVLAGSPDGTVQISDAANGKAVKVLKGHKGPIEAIAASPADGAIASSSTNGEVRFWNGVTGEPLRTFAAPGNSALLMTFAPNGTWLFSAPRHPPGSAKGHGYIWSPATGKVSVDYTEHDGAVTAAAVSRDGRLIATAGGDNQTIRIWDPATGKTQAVLKGDGANVWAVRFSADSRAIAWAAPETCSGSEACASGKSPLWRKLRLPLDGTPFMAPEPLAGQSTDDWRGPILQSGGRSLSKKEFSFGSITSTGLEITNNGKPLGSLNYVYGDLYSLVPEGKALVANSSTGSDGDTAELAMQLMAKQGFARRGAFANQATVVTGFDVLGRQRGSFVGHESANTALAPSPDGRLLVTGGHDQTLRIWNLKTFELLATLFEGTDGEWVMWTPQGYYAASPHGDRYIAWQINQGPLASPEHIGVSQLRKKFYRPDIVARAIDWGSAERAIQAARVPFQSAELEARRSPPKFAITSPSPNSTAAQSPLAITLNVESNEAPVKGLDVTVNGRQISTRGDRGLSRATGEAFAKTFDAPLEKGENRIRINVFNDVGDTVKELIVNHAGGGPATLDKRGALYVLAVGVDAYSSVTPLRFAGADAKAFRDAVVAKAGPLHQSVKTAVLASGGDKEPTRVNIEAALELFRDAKPEDTVMMFLAGHGVNEGADYLFLPQDASSDGEHWRVSSAITWYRLQTALQSTHGRRLLFVDTCHAGGAFNPRLIKDAADAQIIVFSATDDKTLAQERPELGHGVFTHALVSGINGEADLLKHGAVNLFELTGYVANKVKTLTNNAQEPTIHLSGAKDFPIATH